MKKKKLLGDFLLLLTALLSKQCRLEYRALLCATIYDRINSGSDRSPSEPQFYFNEWWFLMVVCGTRSIENYQKTTSNLLVIALREMLYTFIKSNVPIKNIFADSSTQIDVAHERQQSSKQL